MSRSFWQMTGIAVFALAARCPSGESVVRVQSFSGGPQIVLDGKPVRPWMFFGNPRPGTIHAGPKWERIEFSFSPDIDIAKSGTLHFRFGHVPGDVWVRNVSIIEKATGRPVLAADTFTSKEVFRNHWDVWPPDERNTVGKVDINKQTLHVHLSAPPKGRSWPDFHIPSKTALSLQHQQTYTGSFEIRADPARDVTVSLYSVSGGVWRRITTAGEWGPDNVFLRQIDLARQAGVRFITFSCPYIPAKSAAEQYWTRVDELCRAILRVHPDALLIPRIGMGAPGWWYKEHPEDRMVFEDGKAVAMPSVSSRIYRRDAAEWLTRFCRHMMEAFPTQFAGVHPCGQNTGEWFYYQAWERPLSGYDPATLRAWRAWLKEHDVPGAATAAVPSPDERHASPHGLLRSPNREAMLIEFSRFRQREMADTVLALAKAARQATEGKKLVVFFYGYFFEFASLPNGPPECGHYALQRVLPSPDIDILCSPISYFDRQWRGSGPSMTVAESILAAGKLWLNEDDTRTWLAHTTRFGGAQTLEQTQAIMTRNLAQESLRGFGTWWMDLIGDGWYNDARIWDSMRRLQPLGDRMLERTRPYTPDVAVILGEDSMACLAADAAHATRPLISLSRGAFGRSACSCGQYLLADAAAEKVPARLHVYLAAWSLSAAERQRLAANHPPERTRVWCWIPPGWIDRDHGRNDAGAALDITGFHTTPVQLKSARVQATKRGRELGLPKHWGSKAPVNPLFTTAATDGEILAVWDDGSPAVVRQPPTRTRGAEIFYGPTEFTPEVVRALCRLAGLTPMVDADAAVWSAENRIFLFPLAAGKASLQVEKPEPVRDAWTGKTLGPGPAIPLTLRPGEPHLLDVGK